MPHLTQRSWLFAALLLAAVGCKPKIGDDCNISTDCSASGDRLCDITQPGGYCTVYNCEPATCPEDESLCVEFGAQRSPLAACIDKQSPSPYRRAFCMATCKRDSDCRSGYVCADLSSADNHWGALLIDGNRGSRACLVPLSAAPVAESATVGAGEVCRAQPPERSSSVGGTRGVDAAAGAGESGAPALGGGGADQGGAGG